MHQALKPATPFCFKEEDFTGCQSTQTVFGTAYHAMICTCRVFYGGYQQLVIPNQKCADNSLTDTVIKIQTPASANVQLQLQKRSYTCSFSRITKVTMKTCGKLDQTSAQRNYTLQLQTQNTIFNPFQLLSLKTSSSESVSQWLRPIVMSFKTEISEHTLRS